MAEHEHDVVVFGATGFTGALTAEYLAANAGAQTRWALAGRNRGKLEALRDRLEVDVPLLHADAGDPASLQQVAAATKVIITTVGPYIEYGEPLVAACAQEGTDYVDLTGEPEFMDLMYVRHHRQAAETGARIVHACGFDAIPQDLGAFFTVRQLPEGVPIKVEAFVRLGGKPSGGTVASSMLIMARMRHANRVHAERLRMEGPDGGRRVRSVLGRPRRESSVNAWLLPMPTIDPMIVRNSARLSERYGPDFTYSAYVAVRQLPVAIGMVGGVSALAGLAHLPPARKLVASRVPPGTGPSPEQRAKSWFKVRFAGEGGGRRVLTEVSGGDPGYGETSKMLAESALCLAHDELPETAGQVTTASAMGEALTARLQRAGIKFEVVG